MSENKCPKCGTLVIDELPGGMCPTCLMAVARQSMEKSGLGETAEMYTPIEPPSTQELAELFTELEIVELIGKGGMGAVFKARQKSLDRLVALKIFLFRADDEQFTQRFSREAKALAKLNHPNIVTVHDFGQRANIHYLVMEFVDGLNLRELTRTEEVAPDHALELVPQLCDALQYAHDQGIIHRDIKPENVLLDKQGRIKIADFGLAKITGNSQISNLTNTRQVMGTWNYMAPEQRERPLEVDHRADIYSLGVVIYELLTGELPVGRFQPPSAKAEVATQLDEVVLRALEKEPDRRYQQISEFKTGFQSVPAYVAAPTKAPAKPVKAASIDERRQGAKREISMMIYHLMAMLTCMSGGLVLMLGSMDSSFDEDRFHMIGILICMFGGFLFAITSWVRRLVGARPDSDDKTSLEEFENSTVRSAVLKIIAMFFAIGCGAMFIVRHYNNSSTWMFALAIACGIVAALLFTISGSMDEIHKRFGIDEDGNEI